MDLINALMGFLGGIGDAIVEALAYIFNLLIQIASFIWQVLVAVGNWVWGVFKSIGDFFVHLWNNFFKGIFSSIWHGIVAATRWLEAHLRPIIQFLQRVRAYIDRIYRLYVRPFLSMIQHIRGFLQILRLLHISFATKLDNFLGTIQRDVQGAFNLVRGVLNSVIDLLNIVADPTKLLRHPTLILSIRRSILALIRQTTGLPPGFFIPSRSSSAVGLGFLPANFNPADPAQNPPPSYYLGFDSGVPSFEGLVDGQVIPDTAIDDLDALDFFTADTVDDLLCSDPVSCLAQAARSASKGQ